MIEKLYAVGEDGARERLYHREVSRWVLEQPQDTWLLFVRSMNWDDFDELAEAMIDDPRCDAAVATLIFWMSDPAFAVRHPTSPLSGRRTALKVIANARRGLYRASDLALAREELTPSVQGYLAAIREPGRIGLDPPKILFGPLSGRQARVAPLDAKTERALSESLDGAGAYLPRSYDE